MDFCIGTPVFWLVGFGLMFGTGNGFIGKIGGIATEAHYGSGMLPDGVPFWAFLIFQTVFCATSATIVSGAMAERTKFLSYCVYSLMISLVVYPVSGHWIWGGGFISQMGFHDFAGSCAVHMVGGVREAVQKENSEAAGKAHESYVIQPGDTLFQISMDRYGSIEAISQICKLNGMSADEIIYPGQVIVLP